MPTSRRRSKPRTLAPAATASGRRRVTRRHPCADARGPLCPDTMGCDYCNARLMPLWRDVTGAPK
jgi:hypothetical protein